MKNVNCKSTEHTFSIVDLTPRKALSLDSEQKTDVRLFCIKCGQIRKIK